MAADNNVVNNNNLHQEKDKAVSPPLPAAVPAVVPVDDDDTMKQISPLRRTTLLAVLLDVKKPPPAASSPLSSMSISPPPMMAVMPADNNNDNTTTASPPPWIVLMVFLWAFLNAVVFVALDMATLILNFTPSTTKSKPTWPFHSVTLTDAAAEKVGLLLCGELLCSEAAALATLLHVLLTITRRTTTTTTTTLICWVALAATVGMHCTKVASNRVVAAAVDHVAFGYLHLCLAVDLLLAGVLLLRCCSPRRRLQVEMIGELGGDDGIKVVY